MRIKTIAAAVGAAAAVATGVVASLPASSATECACSSGVDCDWREMPSAPWSSAPRGRTLLPDMWRGDGCRIKPCIESKPGESMPAECQP